MLQLPIISEIIADYSKKKTPPKYCIVVFEDSSYVRVPIEPLIMTLKWFILKLNQTGRYPNQLILKSGSKIVLAGDLSMVTLAELYADLHQIVPQLICTDPNNFAYYLCPMSSPTMSQPYQDQSVFAEYVTQFCLN